MKKPTLEQIVESEIAQLKLDAAKILERAEFLEKFLVETCQREAIEEVEKAEEAGGGGE